MSDSDDLERYVLVQKLKPDRVDDYLEAHEEVPDPVVEKMAETGIQEFRLFVEGEYSIGYIVAEDFERFQEEYSDDPDCMSWEERVGEFKQRGVDTESGEFPVLEEVWTFVNE
jgi:L-rhamnose mutarotase